MRSLVIPSYSQEAAAGTRARLAHGGGNAEVAPLAWPMYFMLSVAVRCSSSERSCGDAQE